jgi:EamA domain-containing membrane protein RarD
VARVNVGMVDGAAARAGVFYSLGAYTFWGLFPICLRLQLLSGVIVFHEAMNRTKLSGYALIWLGFALASVDGLRAARTLRIDARAV